MLRDRPWATAAIWILSALMCQILSFVGAVVKGVDAPLELRIGMGILLTPLAALLFVRVIGSIEDDLRAARVGTTAEQRAMLATPRAPPPYDFKDGHARAALAIEAGDLDLARRRLSLDRRDGLVRRRHLRLVLARLALAERGQAAAEETLAGLASLAPMRSVETERYRAYVIALAAILAPDRSAAAQGAAPALAAHRDAEVRAYAAWIRAKLDLPLAEDERAADAHRGAEVARARGHAELAHALESRASALAAKTASPYRGDGRRVA